MSSRRFLIQARMSKTKWITLKIERTLIEAYDYLKNRESHDYPFRIVRIVRTIVFEEEI